MYIDLAVKLSAKAWCLSILAALHSGTPARQAPLLKTTGASRGGFAQSLAHLQELKLLERNPGHGHPLRPEFRLTESGKTAAQVAHTILSGLKQDADQALFRKSWALPILLLLTEPSPNKYLKTSLAPITDRALSETLKSMEAQGWVRRTILADSRPPRPMYSTARKGTALLQALELR